MYKPKLYELSRSQEIIKSFGGYQHNPVIDDNCFFDERNMSCGNFPLLSPRNKRAFFNVSGERLHGLFSKGKICYINNGTFYYGGESVEGISFPDIEEERKFVSMGAKLLVFPDKVYVNTADLSDYGSLEAYFETEDGTTVTCSMCKGDGDLYENYTVSSAEPENPENSSLWLDTSVTPNVLKQYSESLGMWMEIAETYVRIASAGIGKNFKVYDGVTVSGFESEELNGSFIIRDCGDDYITVTGILSDTLTQTSPVSVSRTLPDMDVICESGNRIWGCNSEKNEIYASKLGDPSNFNCFMGISTDSYAVTVGTDGDFTGAATYRGYIVFFKENCIHKIYGQNPPYTVNTSYIRGVQKGSHKSIAIVNETLYYKSPNGICAFEGGIPVDISKSLGSEYYTEAVAGTVGDKYYICMTDKNGTRTLFCYDEIKALWHREDDIDIKCFATHNCNLYFIGLLNGEKRLCLVDGVNRYGNFTGELSGYTQEDDFGWFCETGLWGLDLPENKYYSGIVIRLTGEKGAKLQVDFQTDSKGIWERQLSVTVSETGSVALPFITPRCDHLKIRISGKGNVKIFSISRKTETGSELNV